MNARTITMMFLWTVSALVMTACRTTNANAGEAEAAGWQLVFSDDFDRDALGDDWQVISGTWEVEDGHLVGSGTLVSSRGLRGEQANGFMRMEFKAATDVQPFILMPGMPPPRVQVSDISSFLHAQGPEEVSPIRTGYFFQFGGRLNIHNRLRRQIRDMVVDDTPENLIVPDKLHHVVVENDAGNLRMYVDGVLRLEADDPAPLVGEGQDRVGFYFYTAAKVESVRVYVKSAME